MTRTTLADLTVGDLKRLLQFGDESFTLDDALRAMAESDRVSCEHQVLYSEYEAYRARRQERYAAELASAAAAANDDLQKRGRGDGERMAARQAARVEAAETFEEREPLLEFAEWQDAGRPEVHEVAAGAVKGAVAKFRELVS
jgi:hypothetical protein